MSLLELVETNTSAVLGYSLPAVEPCRRSSFSSIQSLPNNGEGYAITSIERSQHLEQILDVLLTAARPGKPTGPRVLRPIWAEEALQRVYNMMRLVDARNLRGTAAGLNPVAAAIEFALAQRLADLFKSLEVGGRNNMKVGCSQPLWDIVANLVALFGAAAGEITLSTNVEQLTLSPYRRRALVLAAGELVGNALLHAFAGRRCGWIGVSLTALNAFTGRLRVADDGTGFAGQQPNFRHGIAAGLADLLEGELVYYRTSTLTIAEIEFPI